MNNLIKGIQTDAGAQFLEPSPGSVILPGKTTVFNADGSITEITEFWTKRTVFLSDSNIVERTTFADGSWKQNTISVEDGNIVETVTEGST